MTTRKLPANKLPDRGHMPLRLAVGFTEAEAVALADLARLLAGGSVRQPLITALNKVERELGFARRAYASTPTGREIRTPSVEAGDEVASVERRRGRPRAGRIPGPARPTPEGV